MFLFQQGLRHGRVFENFAIQPFDFVLIIEVDNNGRQKRDAEQHQKLPHDFLYDGCMHRRLLQEGHADLKQFFNCIEFLFIQQE